MRLPGGLSVGYPLEHPAGDSHLFIELGEEQLGDRHLRTPSGESREGSRPTAGPARTGCSTRPPPARRGTPRPCRGVPCRLAPLFIGAGAPAAIRTAIATLPLPGALPI